MAGVTGLEPVASGVTGRHSDQLSYTPSMGGLGYGVRGRDRTADTLGFNQVLYQLSYPHMRGLSQGRSFWRCVPESNRATADLQSEA